MESNGLEKLNKNLELLIRIVVASRSPEVEVPGTRAQIRFLDGLGVSPSEIGRVIGKPTNAVTSVLAKIRRQSKGSSEPTQDGEL